MLTDNDRLLVAALKNNHLMSWDLTTGLLRDCIDWTKDFFGQNAFVSHYPTAAAISTELELLAVVYKGRDILLWDIEREAVHETYGKYTGARLGRSPANATVWSLIFNPAPAAALLAAAYSDGDLVLFDISTGKVKETILANTHCLACSPDGRTLASGNYSGVIQLFDFKTLNTLYCINSDDLYGMKQLAFSGDSRRLLDIAVSQCRVWDPTVLLREEAFEEVIDTVSMPASPLEIKADTSNDLVLISALAYHETGEVFFCGRDDGSVSMYESISGQQSQKLFSHAACFTIKSLYYDDQSHTLDSVDSSQRILAHELTYQRETYKATRVFDHRNEKIMSQVVSNKGHTRMLVCSPEEDTLWSVMPDGNTVVNTASWENRGTYIWGSHPSNQDHLILIVDSTAHLYEWQTLRRLTSTEGISLQGPRLEPVIQSITPCFNGDFIATVLADSLQTSPEFRLLTWNA